MGWESRRGGRYYYRKRRYGRHVISDYVGRGEWVDALASLELADRMGRAVERDERQNEAIQDQADEAALDAVTTLFETMTAGFLLAAGCHTHRGIWRRKR